MSPAEFRIKSCENKVRYTSEKEALNLIKKNRKRGIIISPNLNVYGPCQFCHGWHIGHSSKGKV
jgi:hypothetical protein